MGEGGFDFTLGHFSPHAFPVMAVSLLIFCIGLLILFQTRRTIKDIAFFLFCMSSTLWLFTMGFVYSAPDAATALRLYKTLTFFGVINLTPNLYLFAACASGLLHKQKFWVTLTYVLTYSMYVFSLVTNQWITTPHLYFWGYYPHYEPLTYSFLLTFAIVFFANQVHLKIAYERETQLVKKQQIRFIKLSLLFGLTAFIDFAAKIWIVPIYPAGFLSMFTLIVLLAYSIIRYKAFDIETVIHKTALWLLSFSVIMIPIFALYRFMFVFMRDSFMYQALFGLAAFIIFTVYLRVIQPKVDHLFQRRKADLEGIIAQFTQELVQLKGVDSLVKRIEGTIKGALYPQWVDIFIYNDKKGAYYVANRLPNPERASVVEKGHAFLQWMKERNRIAYRDFIDIDPEYQDIKGPAAEYFKVAGGMLAIPLVLNDELLGVIQLEKKENLKRYSAIDIQFLTVLKNQSAVALSNSLIYQNIEEQVKERTRELVDVQRQLIQAEKLATVGTLSGGVAHEINNPLTAILTNVQMLLAFSDDEGAKMDKESLQMIEEATQRCRTIVQKLMVYAKKPLESDEVAKTDLSQVLGKTLSFIGYQLEQDNIKVVVEEQPGPLMVMANPNEMEQVFTNIILNARDAIKEAKARGNIYINLFKKDKHVIVEIRDEGVGMPPERAARVFDPFFTTKDVGKGLGLGLSICQSIIEKYHGKITVQSEVGKGTTFSVGLGICIV